MKFQQIVTVTKKDRENNESVISFKKIKTMFPIVISKLLFYPPHLLTVAGHFAANESTRRCHIRALKKYFF